MEQAQSFFSNPLSLVVALLDWVGSAVVAIVVVAEEEHGMVAVVAGPIVGAVVHKIAVVKMVVGIGDLEVYTVVERGAILD